MVHHTVLLRLCLMRSLKNTDQRNSVSSTHFHDAVQRTSLGIVQFMHLIDHQKNLQFFSFWNLLIQQRQKRFHFIAVGFCFKQQNRIFFLNDLQCTRQFLWIFQNGLKPRSQNIVFLKCFLYAMTCKLFWGTAMTKIQVYDMMSLSEQFLYDLIHCCCFSRARSSVHQHMPID